MDNVCHTLVGAACGAAGLNHRTRFAAATLLDSANLPDVDVLVYLTNTPWIEFRGCWTHGDLAQLAACDVEGLAHDLLQLAVGRVRRRLVVHHELDCTVVTMYTTGAATRVCGHHRAIELMMYHHAARRRQ